MNESAFDKIKELKEEIDNLKGCIAFENKFSEPDLWVLGEIKKEIEKIENQIKKLEKQIC